MAATASGIRGRGPTANSESGGPDAAITSGGARSKAATAGGLRIAATSPATTGLHATLLINGRGPTAARRAAGRCMAKVTGRPIAAIAAGRSHF